LNELVQLDSTLKNDPFLHRTLGKDKTIGLVFFNPSLRTRLSTQKAAQNLGLNVIVMNFNSDGWNIELEDGAVMNQGSQEHIKEAAGVMSQYCDILGVRTFANLINRTADYEEILLAKLKQYATVPILSLESATGHPLQALADLLTIKEHCLNKKPKIVLTWAPHPKALPQAVANSFAQWTLNAGYDLTIAHPEGFELAPEYTKGAQLTFDQRAAFQDADIIYAKNWSSYKNYGQIGRHLEDWIVNEEKMQLTNNAHFMHCLPVRRNVVVTDAVIDSENSLVLQQANNRTWAAQAAILKLLKNDQ
jgi:N-succinyl-L-ornithine transcarbamylase